MRNTAVPPRASPVGGRLPRRQLLWPLLTSAMRAERLSTPSVIEDNRADLPGYCALTFTLMPVGSTSQPSVQVLGFASIGPLTPLCRLSPLLFLRPAICLQLPP